MGNKNLAARANGKTIDQTWFNDLEDALEVDFIPRDATGAVVNEAGGLGNSTTAWLRAYISSGYFSAGDIKAHHSFNGTISAGEGWMKCDGRQITSANYDTEHGSGHFAKYCVTSPILNKYLPDLRGRYPVGASTGTTTQTGASAITAVGNSSHQIDIAHTHTLSSHSHTVTGHTHSISAHQHGINDIDGSGNQGAWAYGVGVSNLKDHCTRSSSASGWLVTSGDAALVSGTAYGVLTPGTNFPGATDSIISDGSGNQSGSASPSTDSQSPGMNSQLSATQSIQPDSIEVEYYMRII